MTVGQTLARVARNAGYLVSGKGVGGLLQLASMGVAGRALGPEAFGVLVLVHTYALTASGVAKFQSWQAIIQYGAPHLHSGDRRKLGEARRRRLVDQHVATPCLRIVALGTIAP